VWWFTPVISELERLGQQDLEFKACLGYIERSFLEITKK
jgi:hypothetical protein